MTPLRPIHLQNGAQESFECHADTDRQSARMLWQNNPPPQVSTRTFSPPLMVPVKPPRCSSHHHAYIVPTLMPAPSFHRALSLKQSCLSAGILRTNLMLIYWKGRGVSRTQSLGMDKLGIPLAVAGHTTGVRGQGISALWGARHTMLPSST